jgi:hypothetical protein
MQNWINALLNCLLVSIPEEIVWVTLTLVLLKRFDLLDWRRWKRNIKWLSIPIIPVAISINILKYIFVIPRLVMSISTLIMLILLIIYIVKKTDKLKNTKIYKVILFTLFGSCLIAFTEAIYIPIILFMTNLKISQINIDILNNFLFSLPERIIQICFILYIIYGKTYKLKYNYGFKIFENKLNVFSLFSIIIILVVFWLISLNVFSNQGIFRDFPINLKILLGTAMNLMPTLFFVIMVINNLTFIQKNIQIEQKYSDMLDEK